MNNRYKVIEDRGCGIKYSYQSDLILNDAVEIAYNMNHRAEQLKEEGLQNGNNDPYVYFVEKEDLTEADCWDGDESDNFLQ